MRFLLIGLAAYLLIFQQICLLGQAVGAGTGPTYGSPAAVVAAAGGCPDPVAGTYTGTAASMTDAATAYTDPALCYN